MVDQALDVWQQFAAQASPALATVINDELAATNNLQDFVAGSFDDWSVSIGVLPPGGTTFLPVVAGPAGTTNQPTTPAGGSSHGVPVAIIPARALVTLPATKADR